MFRPAHFTQSSFALLFVALLASPLSAGMISNTGFENHNGTNNFDNWTELGDVLVDDGTVGVDPKFGDSQALLRDGTQTIVPNDPNDYGSNVAAVDDIEFQLGLKAGTLTRLMDAIPNAAAAAFPARGSAIYQDFMGMAGQELTFCWKFLTNEDESSGLQNPDIAFVSLVPLQSPPLPLLPDPRTSEAVTLLTSAADQTLTRTSSTLSGFYFRESNYNQITLTLPSTGQFRLGFGVVAAKDAAYASALLVDDPGNIVPEPSAILLTIAAALCLIPFAVNRRKRLAAVRLS